MRMYWIHVSDSDKAKIREWVVSSFGEENEDFLNFPWPYEVWVLFLEFLEDLGVGKLYYKEVCECCGPELHFDVTHPYAYPYEYLKLLEDTKMFEVREFFLNKLNLNSKLLESEKNKYILLSSFTLHDLPLLRLVAAHFYHKEKNVS